MSLSRVHERATIKYTIVQSIWLFLLMVARALIEGPSFRPPSAFTNVEYIGAGAKFPIPFPISMNLLVILKAL